MEIDLRRNPYRLGKKYWRAKRERMARRFHIYKKPVLTAIKLDPKQAIFVQCQISSAVWFSAMGHLCVSQGMRGASTCDMGIRGRRSATHTGNHQHHDEPPS